jgi:ATP-dependent Zn protease
VCGLADFPLLEIVSDPLRLTAYHEAGHAVMAQLCGQQLTEVEIVGDEEHTGSVRSLRFVDEEGSSRDPAIPTAPVERRLLCTVAGMVAENLVTGHRELDESCEDLDAAVQLAMKVVGDCERVIPYLEVVREHTEDLLRRNWDAVEALADALVERRRMSGEEVRRLLAPLLPV